jgi:hypothetical protein
VALAAEQAAVGDHLEWPATTAPSSVWRNPASRMKPGPISISWVSGTPS